jgi:hypothetical protein
MAEIKAQFRYRRRSGIHGGKPSIAPQHRPSIFHLLATRSHMLLPYMALEVD